MFHNLALHITRSSSTFFHWFFILLCPLSLLACYCSRVAWWKVRASCRVYFGKMNNVAIDLVWADSFLGQKFLASGCFLLAGCARIAAWSRWLSSTQHSINMHNMTGFGGRLLECWFVSSSEWNDVWLWSHQAWTSKARESLPPRSWGCHWLVTMCLCPIDCEMVCCYTAVLHLRPTEVIDWFGHVECSHLVCSNVFFLLGFFFSFLPLLSHFPFMRKPRVLAGDSEQAAAKAALSFAWWTKWGCCKRRSQPCSGITEAQGDHEQLS